MLGMLLLFVLSCAKDTPAPDSSVSIEQTDGSSESETFLEFRNTDPDCACYMRVLSVSGYSPLEPRWIIKDRSINPQDAHSIRK